jgi:hypothetical protein
VARDIMKSFKQVGGARKSSKRTSKAMKAEKRLYVEVTEEMIMNYDALPPEMKDWQRFRIGYGGGFENCLLETVIYLPPRVSVERLERLLNA